MSDAQVELCYVEGRKIALLANENPGLEKYTKEQLFECVVNKDDVRTKVKVP
jgi:hypothetical protein